MVDLSMDMCALLPCLLPWYLLYRFKRDHVDFKDIRASHLQQMFPSLVRPAGTIILP